MSEERYQFSCEDDVQDDLGQIKLLGERLGFFDKFSAEMFGEHPNEFNRASAIMDDRLKKDADQVILNGIPFSHLNLIAQVKLYQDFVTVQNDRSVMQKWFM